MWLIIGLGNPGRKFVKTRHNFGYMVADHLAEKYNLAFSAGKGSYFQAQSGNFTLFKPSTFMNNCGTAVKEIVGNRDGDLSRLLVIYDDIDLELGRLRLRPSGSAGGHKGMESIIYHLESDQFPRLRMGIGPQPEGIPSEDWVLAPFTKSELPLLKSTLDLAMDCIQDLMRHSLEYAMNLYNRKRENAISEM